ncbi:hypothetical protein [Anianabacter salinae]|uniref:hypothetical protein n=1 Tax=Anianabacter salinae TaxID=2851023 RepID=UPI00225E1610|nr:hypothetical protein [Anianabacter salinae]MBV0911541.1 hypothetical protein [Anianabacter salinae]
MGLAANRIAFTLLIGVASAAAAAPSPCTAQSVSTGEGLNIIAPGTPIDELNGVEHKLLSSDGVILGVIVASTTNENGYRCTIIPDAELGLTQARIVVTTDPGEVIGTDTRIGLSRAQFMETYGGGG